jgi:hypothetical protein
MDGREIMDKLNISVVITVATILLSVGGSWAVMKSKTDEVDKIKTKTESMSEDVTILKVKIDGIKESIAEQKQDTKQILRLLMDKKND